MDRSRVDAPASPSDIFTGLTAAILVCSLHVVLPLGLGIFTLVGARRLFGRARAADASWVETAPLVEGEATLHGTVEYARGREVALRLEIEETGREAYGKNGQEHRWTETNRKVTAAPFYVQDRRGMRVRVEPDDRALLIDKLDGAVRTGPTTRNELAELSPNEVVYVVGELRPGRDPEAGAYRGDDATLVMVPPRGGRMLVSTEALGRRFREDASSRRAVAMFFFACLLLFALFDIGYYARVFSGHAELGTVLAARQGRTESHRCELTIVMSGGEQFDAFVDREWCSEPREGSKLPIYHGGSSWFAHIGREPGVHWLGLVVACVLLGGAALLTRRGATWYEGGKISEYGTGPLLPPYRGPG